MLESVSQLKQATSKLASRLTLSKAKHDESDKFYEVNWIAHLQQPCELEDSLVKYYFILQAPLSCYHNQRLGKDTRKSASWTVIFDTICFIKVECGLNFQSFVLKCFIINLLVCRHACGAVTLILSNLKKTGLLDVFHACIAMVKCGEKSDTK